MIELLFGLALLEAASDECPAFVRLKVRNQAAATLAQNYADCLTRPEVPLASRLPAARQRCAPMRENARMAIAASRRGAGASGDPLDWIDYVASNLAGCETAILLGPSSRDY